MSDSRGPFVQGWRRLGGVRAQLALCVVMGAASLWLRTGFPVAALGFAVSDDQLFIRTARHLAAGEWLGPYDDLTLVKGMFYPLFICLASLAAIPLKIAEHCVYLAVSALIAWIAAQASQRRWLGSLLFSALAFNPSLWSPALARVIREGLYVSLSPAVIALGIVIAFPPKGRGLVRSAMSGCLLGLTGAGFWLTREEGFWLAPAFVSVLLIAIVDAVWRRPATFPATAKPTSHGARTLLVAAPLTLAAVVFGASLQTVMRLNKEYYGTTSLIEVKSEAFERAYGDLARIKSQAWRRYVVFPTDVRRKAYAASVAARELAPVFEGSLDQRWRDIGCNQMGVAAKDCSEILSGWFFWALRDAVAAAGYYRSAPDAQAYYIRLADEIDAACQRKVLDCLPPHTGLAPPFQWSYVIDSIDPALVVTRILLTMRQGPIGSGASIGTTSQIADFADAVGPVSPVPQPWRRIHAWVGSTGGIPGIRVEAEAGQTVSSSMTLQAADDVKAVFPDLEAVRFTLDVSCPAGRCAIVAEAPNSDRAAAPVQDLRPGMAVDNRSIRLFVDSASMRDGGTLTGRRQALQVRIASGIAQVYAAAMPVLAALGVCGIVAAVARFRKRRPSATLLALAISSLVAVGCRIALLAYLDATSLPATSLLYASPATPFVIVVAILGIYLGLAKPSRDARAS